LQTSSLVTFDIDGTLAAAPPLLEHEWAHLISEDDLENRHYSNLPLADPHLPGFFKHLKDLGFDIGIITARSMRNKMVTPIWLQAKGLVYDWLVVNMAATERVDFLRSVKPGMHFDDHAEAQRYRKTVPVWYNKWEAPLQSKYYTWSEIYEQYKFKPRPEQLQLAFDVASSRF
jgi:hypothetical protein